MSTKLLQDNETNSVALVWPDMKNVEKYKNNLKDFYSGFINLLLQFNIRVFLVINDKDDMRKLTNKLSSNLIANLKMIKFSCDDIWIRDYSPLIALDTITSEYICINYSINGYGGKYNYKKNEDFNKKFNSILFKKKFKSVNIRDIFLEGGNIIFDDKIILFNKQTLRSHNKNSLVLENFRSILTNMNYKIENIDIKNISGDDTNGHIDNLVRIYKNNILYMSTDDKNHPDYEILKKLSTQLKVKSKIFPEYNLIPINHTYDDTITDKGTFLPFSYLNYLHCGKSIFIPKIGNVSENVLNTMKEIFKENQIKFIDISSLLKEYGGLHCCTFNFKYNEY